MYALMKNLSNDDEAAVDSATAIVSRYTQKVQEKVICLNH